MSLLIWLSAVPVILAIIRKYREYSWGKFSDAVCLQNKVVIVTGANSGIGKATVQELLKRKARVIMACRDIQKTKEIIQKIRATIPTGELIPMELDLASLKSVRQFAANVENDFPEVHILINNAGLSSQKQEKTQDGFEMHFGVNHLGHFLLTNLLLDKLKKSAPSRIVIVSSSLHERGSIDFDDLQGNKVPEGKTGRNPRYNNSKLANVYFCRELSERLKGEGVEAFAVCPGFCLTNLFREVDVKWYQYIMFAPIAFFFMRTAYQGCQTVLYCALSDKVIGHSGQIFRNCEEYESSHKFDGTVQKKLWSVSENLVGHKIES